MADESGPAGAAGPETATAPAASPADAAGSDPATATPDIWDQIASLDPDELVKKHPRLAGRLGTMSQKQADRLAEERIAAYRQQEAQRVAAEMLQREQQERIRLAREDPDKLAERVLAEEAQNSQASERAQLWQRYETETKARLQQQIDAIYEDPEVRELWDNGDEALRKRLDFRSYPDFTKFTIGLAKVLREVGASKQADELAKARLEALQADSKTQQFRRDGAAGADLGLGGGPPGGRVFTREELDAMSVTEYRKHKTAIDAQVAAGLVQ